MVNDKDFFFNVSLQLKNYFVSWPPEKIKSNQNQL